LISSLKTRELQDILCWKLLETKDDEKRHVEEPGLQAFHSGLGI
jgi:hypothetical protein